MKVFEFNQTFLIKFWVAIKKQILAIFLKFFKFFNFHQNNPYIPTRGIDSNGAICFYKFVNGKKLPIFREYILFIYCHIFEGKAKRYILIVNI